MSCAHYINSMGHSVANVHQIILNFFRGHHVADIKSKQSFVGIALVALALHLYQWHKFSFWRRKNVKTPVPLPLFGNLLSFFIFPRQQLEVEWPKKYGRIYGCYIGLRPQLVCADAKVLKQICIKDFAKFPNHYFFGARNKYQKHFLILQTDDHWRGMRAIMTPTFSSGKIRAMYKTTLEKCADDLVRVHRNKIESGDGSAIIEAPLVISSFSMGSAVSSFYGINLMEARGQGDGRSDTREEFARRSRAAFSVSTFRGILTNLLPDKLLNYLNISLAKSSRFDFFAEKARKIIEHRQKTPSKHIDYLQLLLDAKSDDQKVDSAESDKHEDHHAYLGDPNSDLTSSWRSSKMKLTEMEVSCQAMMLMMVATETTTTLITNTIYLLAHHLDIQERLSNELNALKIESGNNESGNKFDYDTLTSCLYLDSVVSESLRLMSPAISMDRIASEDYFIQEYNIFVPKGTIVNLAFYAIHRDPEYWPEPEKFDPERFMPENKSKIFPGSYCPFGIGPRSCIGFRFALTEAKVALAKLLTEFKFEHAPGTKYPPEPIKPTLVINAFKNMKVLVRKRDA